jgi:SAM-dependent methyltransferase
MTRNGEIMNLWSWLLPHRDKATTTHSIRDYRRLVRRKLKEHPSNRELALAQAIGSPDMEAFREWGARQVAVLRHHGLVDGMAIYDLGCGCGRTAQELQRTGWRGSYKGVDVVPELVAEITRTCPGYEAIVSQDLAIIAPDHSLDMLFHWSVFTHLYPEQAFIYMSDTFRALKAGGKLVFSFIEIGNPQHDLIFERNVDCFRRDGRLPHLDQFLHRDWIRHFAMKIGFTEPQFTSGADASYHPRFGQSLAVMSKAVRCQT